MTRSRSAVLLLLAGLLGPLLLTGAASAAPVLASPVHAAPAPDLPCGSGKLTAEYHGTSSSRKLYRATPDPLKIGNFPCEFPPDVRAIRLDRSQILLVKGGQLVRRVPFDATGQVRLEQVVAAVHDPAWASITAGTVQLDAALIQTAGTSLLVAAPAVKVLHLVNAPSLFMGGLRAKVLFTGVSVTSWDPRKHAVVPDRVRYRPHVLYSTGSTMSMTSSRLAYLGSDVTSSYGVSWRVGGTTGVVRNCVFEHNFFGVYTYQATGIQFLDSVYRNNIFYGLDPHTNSSHLTIKGNESYGNGSHGIIVSRYVTDSVIEDNYSHDNHGNGIMLDFHSDRNVIRGNRVVHNAQGIVVAGSAHALVEDNNVDTAGVGIRMSRDGATDNTVQHNTIRNASIGMQLYNGAAAATVSNNLIDGASRVGAILDAPRTVFADNLIRHAKQGLDIKTVTTVTGGSISASQVGVRVREQGIASLDGVAVQAGSSQVQADPSAVTRLHDVAYTVSSLLVAHRMTTLDLFGLGVLAFAVLCQLEHVRRQRRTSAFAASARVMAFTGAVPGTVPGSSSRPWSPAPATTATPQAPPAPRPSRFRKDIEGLRAVAVLLVVLAHSSLGATGGYVGVDVFFVISGFLITGQLLHDIDKHDKVSFAAFYARRARRILPAATVVILATLAMAREFASPLRAAGIARDGLFAAVSGVNWKLVHDGTDYFAIGTPPSPFQHFWSLSVEEQFYVLWPLLLALVVLPLGKRLGRRQVMLPLLVVLIAASLALSVVQTGPLSYFGTQTRMWELALGALVAAAGLRLGRAPRRLAVAGTWLGAAGILAAGLLYDGNTRYPGFAVVLPVVGAAMVIALGPAARRGGVGALLGVAPMRFVGRMSYSWYLWHWPLLILLPQALQRDLTATERVATDVFSLGLAVITYYLVEQPARTRKLVSGSSRRSLTAGAILVSISVVTALVLTRPATAGTDPALALPAQPVDLASAQSSTALDAVLRQALATKQLPAQLSPSLAAAPNDFPSTHGCEAGLMATAPTPHCDIFGDPAGTKSMVVLGDSHAGQWVGALDLIAKRDHIRMTVMTKHGCPVGDYRDYISPDLKAVYTSCNAFRDAALAQLTTKHPDVVVVATQARAIAEDEAATAMRGTLNRLKATGARVVFLADTPAPQHLDVPTCLAKNPSDVGRCTLDQATNVTDAAGRSAEIAAAVAAGVTVIDPTRWFCVDGKCPAVIAGTVVYKDTSHITATYARLRSPELSDALKPVLSPAKGTS